MGYNSSDDKQIPYYQILNRKKLGLPKADSWLTGWQQLLLTSYSKSYYSFWRNISKCYKKQASKLRKIPRQ